MRVGERCGWGLLLGLFLSGFFLVVLFHRRTCELVETKAEAMRGYHAGRALFGAVIITCSMPAVISSVDYQQCGLAVWMEDETV